MPDRLASAPSILGRGLSEVASVFDLFEVGVYCVDVGGRFTYVNPAGAAFLGWDAEALTGLPAHDAIHHSRPDGSPFPREDCRLHRALEGARAETDLRDVFWRRDGSALRVAHSIAPLREQEEHVGAIVVFVDRGERQRADELLRTRTAQQTALAALGVRALGGGSLSDVLDHAGALVAETLSVDLSEVLELLDERQGLRLVAGVGWRAGTAGSARVGLDRGSPAGFALACDQPVVVSDWHRETRFAMPALMRQHGVVSGVSVVIRGRDRPGGTQPWGVVGAHSRLAREFTGEDVEFVQSVANTLGLAIERRAAERELRRRNVEMTALADEASKLAEDRRLIMADALDAEARTREGISQLLHDEVLHSLLAADRELAAARRAASAEDPAVAQAQEAVVEAIGELRNAVVALHPVTHAQGGLAAAIKAIADVHARRGRFRVTMDVEPEACGVRDQLIVSLAQELLNNAAQHAQAAHVAITLRRTREGVVFEVADDGRGMSPARPREALEQGHVGLASIVMRVEASGGRFDLTTGAGQGTRVCVTLPAEPPATA